MSQNDTSMKQQKEITDLQMQLLQMGFQLQSIKQAIKISNQKQKIIQYLISSKDSLAKNNAIQNQNQQKSNHKNKNQMKDQKQQQDDDDDFQSQQEEYKMIFLARMDIKISLGKMAAQVATSALAAFKQIQSKIDTDQMSQIAYYEWLQSGQKKIVVKVNSQNELLNLVQVLRKQKINVYVKKSTKQDELNIPQNTITVAAVGPAPQDLLDKLTGHLKLY